MYCYNSHKITFVRGNKTRRFDGIRHFQDFYLQHLVFSNKIHFIAYNIQIYRYIKISANHQYIMVHIPKMIGQ